MKAVMFAYDPDVIVVGGSIASAFELYQPAMMQELSPFRIPRVCVISVSSLLASSMWLFLGAALNL